MIDHKRKLLFIHIARTGGTSVEVAVCGQDWWKIYPETKHLSAGQTRKHYGEDIWNSYCKFTIVRNPWDRLVSMWSTRWWHQSIPHHNTSFSDFLDQLEPHPHERYNSLYYSDIIDDPSVEILYFESLATDLSAFFARHVLGDISLPHAEKTTHGHFTEYYTEELIKRVRVQFARDISRFSYVYPS